MLVSKAIPVVSNQPLPTSTSKEGETSDAGKQTDFAISFGDDADADAEASQTCRCCKAKLKEKLKAKTFDASEIGKLVITRVFFLVLGYISFSVSGGFRPEVPTSAQTVSQTADLRFEGYSCEDKSCIFDPAKEDVEWGYYSKTNGDCTWCTEQCTADANCDAVECVRPWRNPVGYCAWWKTGTCPLSAATTGSDNTCRESTAAPAPDDDDDLSAPPTKEEMNAMLRFQSLFANVMALVLAILSYLNFQRSEERTGCCGAPCCECGCGPPPKGGGCTNVNWAKVFYIQSGLSCLGATSTAVMIAAPTDDYFILVISFLSALVTVILAWIATAPLLDNWEKEVTAKKIAKGGDVCYKLSLSKGTYCICPCLGLKNVFRLALVMEMILICVAFAAFSPHVPFSFDCLLPNNNGTCVTATE